MSSAVPVMNLAVLPMILLGIVMLVALLLGVLLLFMIFRIARGSQETRKLQADEDQLLQETWKQLERFEERLTNLETILLARGTRREE